MQERSKSWENNVKKAKHEFFGIYSNCTTLFKSLYIGAITIYQRKVWFGYSRTPLRSLSYGQVNSGICLQDSPYRLCSSIFAMPSAILFYLMDILSFCRHFLFSDPLSKKIICNNNILTNSCVDIRGAFNK